MFPKLFRTKVAASDTNKFNLDRDTITTGDFGQIFPVFTQMCVPGDKFSINQQVFTRLMPMALPTFGKVNIHTRAFFIPHRIVDNRFTAFITGSSTTTTSGEMLTPTQCPQISPADIVSLFIDETEYHLNLAESTLQVGYDFRITDGSHSNTRYLFTSRGRLIYKILRNLGYVFPWSTNNEDGQSAYPLLSFMKILADWFSNTRFITPYEYDEFFNYEDDGPQLSMATLAKMIRLIEKFYEPDYFTSAWTSPNQSGPVVNSEYELRINNNELVASSDSTDTSEEYSMGTRATHDAMLALSSFVKRNNLVGNRYVDQLLARFGVRPSDEVSNRSVYLGDSSTPVQISDINCSATTDDSVLGQTTGKGLGYSHNGHIKVDVKEHGYIIIVAYIMPLKTQYYQGLDRSMTVLDRFDFFTPEFDNVGMEAIANYELFNDFNSNVPSDYHPNGVFGYCPRYTHYKQSDTKNILSGDFVVNSLNANMQGFHTMRALSTPTNDLTHANNLSFRTLGENEKKNYDRMFMQTNVDNFIIFFSFSVNAIRKMKSISDNLLDEFDEGKTISVRPDSTKF